MISPHDLTPLGCELTQTQCDALGFVLQSHLKWNAVHNISAHRTERDVMIYQLMDSLSVVDHIKPGDLLDVGTGPGFPGLPLAIACPDTEVTLLDANAKKLAFAHYIKSQLGLDNLKIVHQRIEQFVPSQGFSQIISRAFTQLDRMIGLTHHLLAADGAILAMKGARIDEEIECARAQYPGWQMTAHGLPHVIDEQRMLAKITRTVS